MATRHAPERPASWSFIRIIAIKPGLLYSSRQWSKVRACSEAHGVMKAYMCAMLSVRVFRCRRMLYLLALCCSLVPGVRAQFATDLLSAGFPPLGIVCFSGREGIVLYVGGYSAFVGTGGYLPRGFLDWRSRLTDDEIEREYDRSSATRGLGIGYVANPPYGTLVVVKAGHWLLPALVVLPLLGVRLALARRRRMRIRRGQCGACAYDLRGSVSGVCPECGNAVFQRK